MSKKNYVIAPYTPCSVAMFESTDFRVQNIPVKVGTFKKDKSVKGIFNGGEIGIFTTIQGTEYIVFYDYSAKLKSEIK